MATTTPLRVAFLGMGRRSRAFLNPLAKRPDVQIVAGYDTWDEARRLAEETAPGIRTYTDPAALLAGHPGLDLVLVCSRDYQHADHACAAFTAGAHVFTEKPMATTVADCRRMLAASQAAGKRLLVGFNLRHHPAIIEACRFLATGALGRLRSIAEWHDVDLNYFHNWMSESAQSGGLLLQKGSHDLDLFNLFAGAEATHLGALGGRNYYGGDRPDQLHCPECPELDTCPEARREWTFGQVENREQLKCAFRRAIDVNDHHVVNLIYANGVSGSYVELHGSPLNTRRFVLLGTGGRLEFEIHEGSFHFQPRDAKQPAETWVLPKDEGSHGGADDPLVSAIVAAVRDGAPFPTEGREGLQAVRLAVAGELAIRTHRTIDLATL